MRELSHSSALSVFPLSCLRTFLIVIVLCWGPSVPEAVAQSLDEQVLRAVYHVETPAFQGAMRAADWSSYPAFVGAAWAAAGLSGGRSYEAAYRMAVAELAAFAGTSALKRVYRRPRPSAALPGITPRLNVIDRWVLKKDAYSFPSGHAALSFAIATSWSLSYPAWYVVAPGMGWAVAVSLSRVWLGVHYPSDVLAGAFLGAAAGAGVHLLRRTITPSFLKDEAGEQLPILYIRLAIP